MNDNRLLEKRMHQFVDLGGNIEVDLDNQRIKIRSSMLPGMVLRFVFPPITKFIVPAKEEIILLLQIMQLILNEFV